MTDSYFPTFLYLSLGGWIFLFLVFVAFSIYLSRVPDDKIKDYKAKAIENKRRLGIKIYRF